MVPLFKMMILQKTALPAEFLLLHNVCVVGSAEDPKQGCLA
jgi:hypothetical protein